MEDFANFAKQMLKTNLTHLVSKTLRFFQKKIKKMGNS
jgi:hypothetical protein